MRICHLTSVHPRDDTRIFLKECLSLVDAGHTVTLIVADGKGSGNVNGVDIVDVGVAPFGRLGRMLISSFKIFLAAKHHNALYMHFHDPELIPAALLLGRSSKLVFDMHENVPKQLLNKAWVPFRLRKPVSKCYKIFERLLLNKFVTVFAEDSYSEDYPWIANHITVLNFPSLEMIPFQSEADKFADFSVGYIGGGTEERGVIKVAEALQLGRTFGRRFGYQCIGPLRQSVLDNNSFNEGLLEGWINAPGRLNAIEGLKIISRCHVGIAVLQPISNYIDSWPTKMFEYMALGLPVIVSDFPLYRKVIEEHNCGLLVDPQSQKSIYSALTYIADHPQEAWRMGMNGRNAIVDRFNWKLEEKKLLSIYKGAEA